MNHPVTPINEAEAIIDPLWAPELSELAAWTVDPGPEHGLEVRQNWCWAEFEWARRPARGPALRMRRELGVECAEYDLLVLSVMAPERSVVRMTARTDRGEITHVADPSGQRKREIQLALGGATRIDAVTLEIETAVEGISLGWLKWLGLAHSGRLARKLSALGTHDPEWPKHLRERSYTPTFEPAYGLLLDTADLAALRKRHDALATTGTSPFLAAAAAAGAVPPEALIHDFVNFWNDSRYNRERDHGKHILSHGLNAAVAGHLTRDPELLRLAARYALSIASCPRWDDGFICYFPGGTFEHRCFVQSLCAYEVAGILDLAGEMFSPVGREWLLRRLTEEAFGAISYSTWRHEYIFRCNQLAWFSPGRMLSLGVLQRHWPRVRPYIDIAYNELCESLEHTILPDGGYMEGPTYFRCVGRDAGLALYHYSRAVGRKMDEIVPQVMRRCGDFGEAVSSTDAGSDVIPICDASKGHEAVSQAIMAALVPGSAWGEMVRKTFARNRGWPVGESSVVGSVPLMSDSAIAWSLLDTLPSRVGTVRALVTLPEMGVASSNRALGRHRVKLFVTGNRAGAGHTHEDKGSFVLEHAGETFALDPGTCDYSHPLAGILKNCERHNMLVPYGLANRPAPLCPIPEDVKPVCRGDATSFHARIDATPGWQGLYRSWVRTWDSPTPSTLTITDVYELGAGEGVEFYWQTRLGVTVAGGEATIRGITGRARLTAPSGMAWRLEELPLLDGVQRRLALRCPGTSGRLEVEVELS